MKSVFWTLCAVLVLGVVTLAVAPKLRATLWQDCQCRAVQPPEAQALLGQEWARAHARLNH